MNEKRVLKLFAKVADKVARESAGRCIFHFHQPKVPKQLMGKK